MARNIYTIAFLLSGAAGLIYQITWVKMFALVFGNAIQAVSLVVAAFLFGLALGSHVLGKYADRMENPRIAYVWLEILIAASALVISALLPFLDGLYASLMTVDQITSFKWQAFRFAAAFLVLALPTVMMGGTLPVMSKFYVTSFGGVGRGLGALYAANTYGAVAGSFLAGFFLIRHFGVWGSLFTAFLLNFIVAGLVLLVPSSGKEEEEDDPLSRLTRKERKELKKKKKKEELEQRPPAQEEPVETPEFQPVVPAGFAIFLLLVAGFCSIAFEILWTRAFVVSFKSTVYLFSLLLSVFLFGMALGSHVFSRYLDRLTDPMRLFGMVQVGIGLWGFLTAVFFTQAADMASFLGGMLGDMTLFKDMVVMMSLMAVSIFPASFLMGVGYPLICKVTVESLDSIGRRSGMAYAAGTVGGIAGSLTAGFILLPGAGLQLGIYLAGAVSIIAGFAAMAFGKSKKALALGLPGSVMAAMLIVSYMTISGADIGLGRTAKDKVVFSHEGITGTVRVTQEREGGPMTLQVNDYQLATSHDVAVRFGHVPLVLKPDAKDALIISLGSGITSGAAGGHPLERIDCVELVPALLEAQRLFKDFNHGIVSDDRFHLTFWDGRNYVRSVKRKYDLVISDLFQPDSAGVGSLYSLEHYLNVKAVLKDDGAMAQWLPLYQLSPHDLKVIMRTFAFAFEYVTVWGGDVNSEFPTLLLMGASQKPELNLEKMAEALARPRAARDMIESVDIFSFLSFYVMDRPEILEYTMGHAVNTDMNPVIEYSAPGSIWTRGGHAVENFRWIKQIRKRVNLAAGDQEKVKRLNEIIEASFNARTQLLEGKIEHALRNYPQELESYKKAYEFSPHDPFLSLAVFDLGFMYYARSDFRTAAEIFEWSRRINSSLMEAYFYLAKSYMYLGQEEKFQQTFADMAKVNPDLAERLLKK